jgi:hypothetical protein
MLHFIEKPTLSTFGLYMRLGGGAAQKIELGAL